MPGLFFRFAPALLLSVAGVPLSAQSTSLGGPRFGHVFDATAKTVRPLLGIPGSAVQGAPVLAGVDFASIAPGNGWAFLVREGAAAFANGLDQATAAEQRPEGLLAGANRIAWSRNGAFAVLASANQIQRVSLTKTDITLDAPMDAPAIATMAIDSAGRNIVYGVADGDAPGLYLVADGKAPALLVAVASPGFAAFAPDGQTLYVVDRQTPPQVIEYRFATSSVETLAFTDEPAALDEITGLAVTDDGARLVVVAGAQSVARVYEIATRRMLSEVALDMAATRLTALAGNAVYLVNEPGKAGVPLEIVNLNPAPGVYLVPPASQEQQ